MRSPRAGQEIFGHGDLDIARYLLHVPIRAFVHRLLLAVVLVLVAGCCRSPRGHGPTERQAATDLVEATRYERGDGVPRDYRKAAELLQRACADGRGSPVACRRLALARRAARGVPLGDGRKEMRQACSGGDLIACAHEYRLDPEKADAACERGNAEACYAYYLMPSSDPNRDRSLALQLTARDIACKAGVLEACASSFSLDDDVAVARLRPACRAGDADACKTLERPIDEAVLCAAFDYQACATRGFRGDTAALETACDANIAEACEGVAVLARDADVPPPNVLALMERACRAGAKRACGQRADELASGCAAYGVRIIQPGDRRAPLPLSGTDIMGAPWSATAGPLLTIPYGLLSSEDLDAIAARSSFAVVGLRRASDRPFEPALARATSLVVDESTATAKVAASGSSDYLSLIGAWLLLDEALVPVAAIFPNAGRSPPNFSPASLARCATHTLATIPKASP